MQYVITAVEDETVAAYLQDKLVSGSAWVENIKHAKRFSSEEAAQQALKRVMYYDLPLSVLPVEK